MDMPRSVLNAQQRGWTIVHIPRQSFKWVDVMIHIKRSITGREVHQYANAGAGYVAFEQESDASYTILKFNATIIKET